MMENNKSILITGASTGIGRACALSLDKLGFKVFAGVRNSSDFMELGKVGFGNIQPVMLDVSKQDDINDVHQIVSEEKDFPLHGLVNNAGVGISGIIETTPVEEFIKLFDVNFMGLHRVTKTMLPLIRKNRGRIINIGSSSSFMTGPALGPYSASKFAVRAYNDALRIEMKSFGVRVSLVAPGPVESAIWDKARVYKEKVRENTDHELLKVYEIFVKAGDRLLDQVDPIPAVLVANAVVHGLTAKKPKYVYFIGKNAKMAHFFSWMPKNWTDHIFLNHVLKAGKG
jgi:short-subunit dehydrogenase